MLLVPGRLRTLPVLLTSASLLSLVLYVSLFRSTGRLYDTRNKNKGEKSSREHVEQVEGRIGLNEKVPVSIFLGIFSTIDRVSRRRQLRQMYGNVTSGSHSQLYAAGDVLDLRFVVGLPSDQVEEDILRHESETEGDLLVLDCDENVDGGKTYEFFKRLGRDGDGRVVKAGKSPFVANSSPMTFLTEKRVTVHKNKVHDAAETDHSYSRSQSEESSSPPYDFVMKVDDDSYAHLPNLMASLRPHKGKKETYFGRQCNMKELPSGQREWPYMCGLGYVLSWDMVSWISTSAWVPLHITTPTTWEDVQTGYWFWENRLTGNYVYKFSEIYNYNYGKIENTITLPLHSRTIIVHFLKSDEAVQLVGQYFASKIDQSVRHNE